jgi:hypothetical protein
VSYLIALMLAVAALQVCLHYVFFQRKWNNRLRTLERDLQQCSEAMNQMAEIQMKSHRKLTGDLGDMEQRIMDLALPSENTNLPLERRHHVLALARKGISIDEIVKRLNMPRGEAELILNLRNFVDAGVSRVNETAGEAREYAQA